jgi:dTDP-4-amino-4,6-dideoxygalactose transaminase
MYTLLRYQDNPHKEKICSKKTLREFFGKKKYFAESANGRSLLNCLLKKLKIKKNDIILTPIYAPEGILDPIKYNKIKILHYKLDKQLYPNIKDIKKIVKKYKNEIKLFVVIHNMGFISPIDPIKKVLNKFNIPILEDCAQANFCKNNAGKHLDTTGNYLLYSLNKFIPVTDGAFLYGKYKIIKEINKEKKIKLDNSIKYYSKHLFYNKNISKIKYSNKFYETIKKSEKEYDKYYSKIKNNFELKEISKKTKVYLNNYNFNNLIKKRIYNTSYIYKKLNNKNLKLFYRRHNKKIVPMAIPLIANKNRNELIKKLLENNIFPSIQSSRWNNLSIKKYKNNFKNEFNYLNKHLLITVDEKLLKKDLKKILNILNSI